MLDVRRFRRITITAPDVSDEDCGRRELPLVSTHLPGRKTFEGRGALSMRGIISRIIICIVSTMQVQGRFLRNAEM